MTEWNTAWKGQGGREGEHWGGEESLVKRMRTLLEWWKEKERSHEFEDYKIPGFSEWLAVYI